MRRLRCGDSNAAQRAVSGFKNKPFEREASPISTICVAESKTNPLYAAAGVALTSQRVCV